MNKENLIKGIEECFDDIKKTLTECSAEELLPLFRDYTDEIIKVIQEQKE